MASPFGHSLAGYAVYCFCPSAEESDRIGMILLCIVMANAADLDFLPGILVGQPAVYHQGITHSVGFALLASVGAAGIFCRRRKWFSAIWNVCFLSYLSHLILDLLAPDGRPPFGLPLLWPISGWHFISPVQVFLGVHRADTTSASTLEWVKSMIHLDNLGVLALEVVVLAPFVLFGEGYRRGLLGSWEGG